MKRILTAALLALSLATVAAPARAAAINCTQLTTGLGLCIPKYGTDFSDWARADIAAFTALNSSGTMNSTTSIHTADWVQAHRISGLSTGTAGIQISSYTWFTSSAAFTGGGGVAITYGMSAATGTLTGDLTLGGELHKATSDGSDNSLLQIGGGGAVGSSRGAYMNLWGNESGSPGVLQYLGGVNGYHAWSTDAGGGSVEKMRLNLTGDLGIGTASPATTLDVNGSAQFGNGATKSTFSAIGSLTLASSAILTFDAGAISDGLIYGQDVAASTIPLSRLNQSGCATNEIPKWNGSLWACASDDTGGAGAALLAATQTFSGANTFLSTINFNGAIPGVWVEIASAAVDGASAYTFSGLASTTSYRLEWALIQNTSAGGYHLRLNADSGANYSTILHEIFTNGSEASEGGTGQTYCSITDTAVELPKAGTGAQGFLEFTTVPTLPANRLIQGQSAWTENSITAGVSARASCRHAGSGNLTSVVFTATAGSFTGYFSLQVRVKK